MDLKEVNGVISRRHPWETSRLYFFLNFVKKNKLPIAKSLLDVGAGDAYFAQEFRKRIAPQAHLCCVDLHYSEEKITDGITFKKNLPIEHFDMILLMDVLEHIADEGAFIKELVDKNAHQKTNFLISVPAWQCLYSGHDKKLEHFRRYDPRSLVQVLEQSGLEVLEQGSFFHLLLFPRLVTKLFEKLQGNVNLTSDLGEWKGGALITSLMEFILKMDIQVSFLLRRLRVQLPGLSLWVIARVKKLK